jgi:hypothetical protein
MLAEKKRKKPLDVPCRNTVTVLRIPELARKVNVCICE